MPVYWQTDILAHEVIREAPQGTAIAALKLYICICTWANFTQKERLPRTGCVSLKLDAYVRHTGLSRPMVIAGLRQLEVWGFVEKLSTRPLIYGLSYYDDSPNWTQLPEKPLYGGTDKDKMAALIAIPNRGDTALLALQLYLYLASIRDRSTESARVSYTQACKILGTSRNRLSAAISMLTVHLVTARTPQYGKDQKPTSTYWLRGSKQAPAHYEDSPYVPDVLRLGRREPEAGTQLSMSSFLNLE